MSKVKITLDAITYGPKVPKLDELESRVYAQGLLSKGYRKTSNAYCMVSRIDRDDWLDVLAGKMNCCRADFYNKDGSGVSDRWRDHYIRSYSNDKLIIHPDIIRFIPTY